MVTMMCLPDMNRALLDTHVYSLSAKKVDLEVSFIEVEKEFYLSGPRSEVGGPLPTQAHQ